MQHLSEGAATVASLGAASLGVPIPPAQTKAIIEGILNFIKKIVGKKERGEALTPEENIVVSEDEKVETGKLAGDDDRPSDERNFIQRFFDTIFGRRNKTENFRRRIDARNITKSTIVTIPKVSPIKPTVNATELVMSSIASNPSKSQNYGGRGANDMTNTVIGQQHLNRVDKAVSVKPVSISLGKLTPNTWYQDKTGAWHWINNRGKMVSIEAVENFVSKGIISQTKATRGGSISGKYAPNAFYNIKGVKFWTDHNGVRI